VSFLSQFAISLIKSSTIAPQLSRDAHCGSLNAIGPRREENNRNENDGHLTLHHFRSLKGNLSSSPVTVVIE